MRIVALAAAVLLASGAGAMEARLRWVPGAGDVPVGYRIWLRTASGQYGRPVDAGPAFDAEGGMSFVLDGLDPEVAYTFAVSAYGAGGEQTERSNELTVPARLGPCAGRSEGGACASTDPCDTGVCRNGSCVTGDVADAAPGDATRVRLTLRGSTVGGRVRIAGLGEADPADAGFDLRLLRQDGATLYQEAVPPGSFRVRRRGTVLRYRRPGRLRLVLRRRGDALAVRFRGRLETAASDWTPPFVLTTRVGLDCASALVAACEPARGTRRCEAN